MVQRWLTQGQELNEKMQPILWTELPTCAFVGGGSLWPVGIAKVMPIRLGHSNRVKQGLSVVQNGLVQRIPICNPTGTNVIIETTSIDADIDPFTKT